MSSSQPSDELSPLERVLRIFTDVHPGEGLVAISMAGNVFLLLTAYYVIKPVREALILALESGAEYKSYMSAAIALALLVAVPIYARFASRLPRNRLVVGVTLFFVSHLLLFYGASTVDSLRQNMGLVFYLWVGIFNMMVVAQFWAFANDIYSEEQGKRLFPLIGIGASTGAALGSQFAAVLIRPFGTYAMLPLCAVILSVCAALTQFIHTRAPRQNEPEGTNTPADESERSSEGGAFAMVFRHRYLVLLALFSFTFTLVNTNGEYMLGRMIKDAAVTAESSGELDKEDIGRFIGEMYGQFFFYVNVLGVFLQSFVVSRLVKYVGLKGAFFVLPCIALADALAVAAMPLLSVLKIGKIAENATDYSVNNTVRNMLWLPTTREMKYKAKQAVDTFFVRMGDVASAGLVFLGAGVLSLGVRAFAIANAITVMFWLVLAAAIIRENRRLSERE